MSDPVKIVASPLDDVYEKFKHLDKCLSDTEWWHNYAMKAQEIRFIKGRVRFVGYDDEGNQVKNSPTFSSCVVIFDGRALAFFEGLGSKLEGNEVPVIGKTIEQPKKGSVLA